MIYNIKGGNGKLFNIKDEAENPLSSAQCVSDVTDNESSRVADRNNFTIMKISALEIPEKGPSIKDDRCVIVGSQNRM
nr:transducin/WD40 repeat-like superfamily protein [Tanacetum cinerariifolium]